MSCAADILTALSIAKPASEAEVDSYLHSLATGVTQAVVDYLLASVTSACVYAGAATGAGTGAFSTLAASLLSEPFEGGLKATSGVNEAIAEGFATGLQDMISAGEVTEDVVGILVSTGLPVSFSASGSSHTVPPLISISCSAALERMATEPPAEEDAEQEKLKLMANSLAKLIDDILLTVVVATIGQAPGAGSTGSGAVTASSPAVDSSFPA